MELFSSYTGTDFLVFYAIMLLTVMFLGLWISANLRPEGRSSKVEDMEEVAVLAGGFERHAMAVSSDLMAREALTTGSKNRLRVSDTGVQAGAAGQSILNNRAELKLSQLKLATLSAGKNVEARLRERGLLMSEAEQWKLRWLSVSPYLVLLAIGAYRYQAGTAIGEPAGFLLLLMGVTLVFAILRFLKTNPRTLAGNEVLRDLEVQASRLRRAPEAKEAGYAVALFGTAVLVGTPWEPVHAMRAASSGGGGDGTGGGDNGGDGGCGGGGCGGCGG